MMDHRSVFLPAAVLLLLSVCACAGGGADAAPDAPAASPTMPAVDQEAPPAQTPEAPPSAGAAETPAPVPGGGGETAAPAALSGELVVTFDYARQSGSASNQHAVWIEDLDGNVVRTLYASRWTASGGYRTRPDSIALWAQRAGLANMASAEVDALSGATPGSGPLTYAWDLTDADGNTVPPGDYAFFVEGTLRWRNFVLYSGVITLGADPVTVRADAEFTYEGDGRYAALTPESGENGMIGPVTAVFTPDAGDGAD